MSLSAWLRLTLTPGIGGETQRKLLTALGLPEAVFDADHARIEQLVGNKAARLLLTLPQQQIIDAALAWAEQPDCHIVTLADKDYPQSLLHIPDPPTLLYVRGQLERLNQPQIAIVGSRNATPQGCQTARSFARHIANNGLNVVSGLALGIDAAAHQGALEANNPEASTLAVIGTGADRLYPARNKELAQRIIEHGAILSEFPLGTPALATNFPRRNRLISGLSRGVLVIEAAVQSGSLITARLAAEQGREVFAVPGSIHSPVARGCHQLIKQGAKLVETANDILEELGEDLAVVAAPTPVKTTESFLLDCLGHDPCTLDTLVAQTGQAAEKLLPQLLALELEGQIACLAGNRYQRLS